MILKHHEIPCRKGRINSAGCIGQKQYLRTHQLHQPGGKHHIGNWIPFIIVDPALHADHRHIFHISENKFPGMSRNGGNREAFYLMIVKFRLHSDIIRIIAQPGAEHNGNLRLEINLTFKAVVAFQ